MTQHYLHTLDGENELRITPLNQHSGMDITIQNVNSEGYVYIGGSDVSSTNYGYRINPDTSFSVELPAYDEIWAVSSVNGSQIAKLSFNLE